MRTLTFVLAATLLAAVSATAQQRGQPNLVLTVYAGAGSGHELWRVDRQTLVYLQSTSNPPDTVALSRQVSSALMLGGVFQFFPSAAALGFSVDIGFRTLGLDDTCAPVAPFQADLENRNRTLCENVSAQTNPGGSVITLGVTGVVRVAPAGSISPYMRVGGNLSFTTVSTIAVAAPEAVGGFARVIVLDNSPRRNSFGLLAAGGISVRLGPAYQFRLEIRDDMSTFERVAGPASPTAFAPRETALFHNLGLVLGFDVLLEQKPTRRY